MTDRELLELAAKAVGLRLVWGDVYKVGPDVVDCTDMPYAVGSSPDEAPVYWNALEDDSDALRLAVCLGITLVMTEFIVDAQIGNVMCHEPLGVDPYTATRRAIVRAAAEIGKGIA